MIDHREDSAGFDDASTIREIDECHFLAINLFDVREINDWSQEELAARASMTQPQIASIEAGHSNPTVRTLSKLATATGLSIADLFTEGSVQRAAQSVASDGWRVVLRAAAAVEQVVVRPSRQPATTDVRWDHGVATRSRLDDAELVSPGRESDQVLAERAA